MCTFCGRDFNSRPRTTKIIRVYDENDKELGSELVSAHLSVREYQRDLYKKYPNWQYTKES